MTDKFTRKETEKLPCRNNSSGGKSRFHQVSKLPCKTHISCGNLMNNFPSSMAVKMQRCARKKEFHERAFPQSFGAAWFLATAMKSSNIVSRHFVTQRVRLVSPHPCMHSWYVRGVSQRTPLLRLLRFPFWTKRKFSSSRRRDPRDSLRDTPSLVKEPLPLEENTERYSYGDTLFKDNQLER